MQIKNILLQCLNKCWSTKLTQQKFWKYKFNPCLSSVTLFSSLNSVMMWKTDFLSAMTPELVMIMQFWNVPRRWIGRKPSVVTSHPCSSHKSSQVKSTWVASQVKSKVLESQVKSSQKYLSRKSSQVKSTRVASQVKSLLFFFFKSSQVKSHNPGLKSAKYLCSMIDKMFNSSYSV